ncbi:PREDICTED: probable N-acetyltransferase 8B [Chrysochloris asiatica]|uniref:Probable N-acetyltransferase 8B n=1 Tax=Chrysochloris asiatica TaxID=185453 RepID=A0A9B0U658_CHRAS|nr:PREDICTED: probable N-acetyltransferase 8B [Chrysochloris asiatica]
MAPYHIRKYQENDRKGVLDVFSAGLIEYAPTTFRHILKLPRTLVLLLGGPLTIFLVSGSWVLPLMTSLALLVVLRLLAKYPWTEYGVRALNTDMSDITKTYLTEQGSCFWVAESEAQVVGMVGCLPAENPALRRKQLQLLHLFVALEHRGQGMAKALVRTVLQFAHDQGYSEVILSTSALQHSAQGLYESFGFQKMHRLYYSLIWRVIAVPGTYFIYHLPTSQVPQAPQQGEDL